MAKSRAQSVIEYTLLIITIAAAFMAMNHFIQRAVNARLHSIETEMNPAIIIKGRPSETPPPPAGRLSDDEAARARQIQEELTEAARQADSSAVDGGN